MTTETSIVTADAFTDTGTLSINDISMACERYDSENPPIATATMIDSLGAVDVVNTGQFEPHGVTPSAINDGPFQYKPPRANGNMRSHNTVSPRRTTTGVNVDPNARTVARFIISVVFLVVVIAVAVSMTHRRSQSSFSYTESSYTPWTPSPYSTPCMWSVSGEPCTVWPNGTSTPTYTPSPSPTQNQSFEILIKSDYDGSCMEMSLVTLNVGMTSNCSGDYNQLWEYLSTEHSFRNLFNSYCLTRDISTGNVFGMPCQGRVIQQWSVDDNGKIHSGPGLNSSSLCIDYNADNLNVHVSTCADISTQQFSL